MAYAERTTVTVSQSKEELDSLLKSKGADQIGIGWESERCLVMFRCGGRHIKMVIPMPDDPQKEMSRWRGINFVIKAKFEAVETGIHTFDEMFMSDMVMPNGKTIKEFLIPQIEQAYETGKMPALLGFESK